ncbi:hypothetical protein Q1695_015681 [Nippostrongylus brasiliensis]|nr:hypothetical protein Q1695_015681 [Nippostrongylus brasiliensis]
MPEPTISGDVRCVVQQLCKSEEMRSIDLSSVVIMRRSIRAVQLVVGRRRSGPLMTIMVLASQLALSEAFLA